MTFQLDPRLRNDCIEVTDLPLSKLLLMNESRYPWFILVPRLSKVTEIIDLTLTQQQRLWDESNMIAQFLREHFTPDKLNIAALGNVVSQLHLHHIARFKNDAAWPQPVWGKFTPEPYAESKAEQIKSAFLNYLAAQQDL